MALWKIIAKMEFKRKTSVFRNHRILFFCIIYFILVLWAFLLAPFLFELLMKSIVSLLLVSIPLPVIISGIAFIIEFILIFFFMMILMYPLQNLYRKTEIGYKEILLSSPITPSDIFLGEFIGKLPFYTIYILMFSPIILGLINPIVNLSFIQSGIIYICIIGLVIFAALIGSILTLWLERKIVKSEKARDLGKALMWVFVIVLVIIMYSSIFLFNYFMSHPEMKNILMLYPSLWFSNIILYIINPILIETYFLNIWFSIGLAIGVPLLVLYLSFKKADAFFSLESGIVKISSIIEKENKFYGFIRKISGHKWEGLIITQFKGYFRKKENIMKIVYAVGLIVVEGILFISIGAGDTGPFEMAIQMIILILIGGMMLGMMMGNFIFIDSRDLLWVYKRSPRNVSALIYSYIMMMVIIILIIDIGFTIFFSFLFKNNFVTSIFFFFLSMIYWVIAISQAIGIQCFHPAFKEKGGDMMLNNGLFIILNIATFIISLYLLFAVILPLGPPLEFLMGYLALPPLIIGIGAATPLIYFGIKKLSKIE